MVMFLFLTGPSGPSTPGAVALRFRAPLAFPHPVAPEKGAADHHRDQFSVFCGCDAPVIAWSTPVYI